MGTYGHKGGGAFNYDQREALHSINSEGVFHATDGTFDYEEVTLEKMKEAMAKMKAMTADHHKQLGEALAKCGILVICDPTLKDHEFRVSPAIHAAALAYAAAHREDFLIHMPRAAQPKGESDDDN